MKYSCLVVHYPTIAKSLSLRHSLNLLIRSSFHFSDNIRDLDNNMIETITLVNPMYTITYLITQNDGLKEI
jgi:hypothetical protein